VGNGRFQHRGGTILTVVLLIQLLSIMLLTVLESTRASTDFYVKTYQMYEARIMKELFLADYQKLSLANKGRVEYNVGTVIYEETAGVLAIQCLVKQRTFRFSETVSANSNEIATVRD
jgi:hypothetical protein